MVVQQNIVEFQVVEDKACGMDLLEGSHQLETQRENLLVRKVPLEE